MICWALPALWDSAKLFITYSITFRRKLYVCVCSFTWYCLNLCTPWMVAHQVLLSMEFSRQEYGSELPFLALGVLPDPGIEPTSPSSLALAGDFYHCATQEDFIYIYTHKHTHIYIYIVVAQSCPTLCDPMGCYMPGFPVLHHLAQTHVH